MANEIDFGILNQVSPTLQVAGATQAAIANMLDRQQKERQMNQQAALANRGMDIEQQRNAQQAEFNQGTLATEIRGQDLRAQEAEAQLGLEQQKLLETQRANDMDFQFKQGQLANMGESNAIDRMYKEGQLRLNQDELAMNQLAMQNQEQMQAAMRQAAQGGIGSIKQLLLQQGNVRDAMYIDKTQSEIEKNFLAGQKSLLEIQDAQEQRNAAQAAAWVTPRIQGIASMNDPEARKEALIEFAQKADAKFGTNFMESADNPDMMLTALTSYAAANNKDLVKAVKTLGPAAAPLVEGYFGKQVDASKVGTEAQTNITIQDKAQTKLLEPAMARITAADTAIETGAKRVANLENLYAQYQDAISRGINPGTFGPAQQALAKVTDSLGLTEGKASPGEAIENLKMQAALSMRVPGSGSMSDSELKGYLSSTAGLDWANPEAVKKVLDFEKLNNQRATLQRDFLVNWVQLNGTDAGASAAWNKYINENPVVDKKGNIDFSKISNPLAYVEKYDQAKAIEEAKAGRASIYTPPPVQQSNFKNIDLSKITDAQYNEAVQRLEAIRRAKQNGPK